MYTESQLVAIARRENNKKRNYLVVNRLQGKHIPVMPQMALQLFDDLAGCINNHYSGERLLVIGFAETATAIGARVAMRLGCLMIQTTREQIKGVSYLFFSESHSHATEQKLVKEDMDQILSGIQRIVFVEDEVTTGNTIAKIVNILRENYGEGLRFAVASLLNGMDEEHCEIYQEKKIETVYLVKTQHDPYQKLAQQYKGDGKYQSPTLKKSEKNVQSIYCSGLVDGRRFVKEGRMEQGCKELWKQLLDQGLLAWLGEALPAQNHQEKSSVSVLGTEEFMYPALSIGSEIEKLGCQVRFHATTRSPIEVSREGEYPLQCRYELISLYEEGRRTFLYNLTKYEKVLVVTDAASPSQQGINSLINALQSAGNTDIRFVHWRE